MLYFLGRWEECAAAFEEAVALDRLDPRAWGNLGNAYHWMPGDRPRMREALENAVALLRERFDREPGTSNDWARLAILDPGSSAIHVYRAGEFQPYEPQADRLPRSASSADWYRGWRDHLEFAQIVGH